ncbi:MAG: DUF4491 family protein [Oscillospiraceae bacterium]|nr:DUF4491 family protein [Oscillospiraceae bacterium]
MNVTGIAIGLAAFLIIGVFHPIVIKGEYYFGKRIWPLFLILGISSCIASLFIQNAIVSPILGVLGFTLFWSIKELYEQEKRVEDGRFPRNPKRKK